MDGGEMTLWQCIQLGEITRRILAVWKRRIEYPCSMPWHCATNIVSKYDEWDFSYCALAVLNACSFARLRIFGFGDFPISGRWQEQHNIIYLDTKQMGYKNGELFIFGVRFKYLFRFRSILAMTLCLSAVKRKRSTCFFIELISLPPIRLNIPFEFIAIQ